MIGDEGSAAYNMGYLIGRLTILALLVVVIAAVIRWIRRRSEARRRAEARRAPARSPQVPPGATPAPQPGWYADPTGVATSRWWDGVQWTDHTQPPTGSAGP
jgi:hypothetical protein